MHGCRRGRVGGFSSGFRHPPRDVGELGRKPRDGGVPLERGLNRCHALTTPVTHQTQSSGDPTVTLFQCLETWRKSKEPGAKPVLSTRRLDPMI